MIESGAARAGRRTGLFTSPHLSEPTERIRVDGDPISAARFAAAFEQVHAASKRLLAEGRIDLHTTYFETVTAMGLLVVREERDMVVLEVGLGGRLDATNVVHPALAVITPIDFDHERFSAAASKRSPARRRAFSRRACPRCSRASVRKPPRCWTAAPPNWASPWSAPASWEVRDLELHPRGSRFRVRELEIECPLAGEHQVENAVTAAAALTRLGSPAAAIEAGIAATRWPGRLERICEHPGDHRGRRAQSRRARARWPPTSTAFTAGRRVSLIFGAMRDKAIDEIGGILFPRAAEVIATAPRQARALSPEAMRDAAEHPNVRHRARQSRKLWRWSGTRRRKTWFSSPARCFWWPRRARYDVGVAAMSLLRSLLISTPLIMLSTVVMGTLSLIASLFDGSGRTQHALARLWAKIVARVQLHPGARGGHRKTGSEGELRVRVESRKPHGHSGDPRQTAVRVPLFRQEGPVRNPVFGHAPESCRAPARGSLERAQLAEEHERRRRASSRERGISVLLFPEGGRSPEGLREFKEGAAYIAIKAGVPVVADGDRRDASPAADGIASTFARGASLYESARQSRRPG